MYLNHNYIFQVVIASYYKLYYINWCLNAFLNAELNERIYVDQSEGFVIHSHEKETTKPVNHI